MLGAVGEDDEVGKGSMLCQVLVRVRERGLPGRGRVVPKRQGSGGERERERRKKKSSHRERDVDEG